MERMGRVRGSLEEKEKNKIIRTEKREKESKNGSHRGVIVHLIGA